MPWARRGAQCRKNSGGESKVDGVLHGCCSIMSALELSEHYCYVCVSLIVSYMCLCVFLYVAIPFLSVDFTFLKSRKNVCCTLLFSEEGSPREHGCY